MNRISLPILTLACLLSIGCLLPLSARNLPVILNDVTFTLQRNSDLPEKLPMLIAEGKNTQEQVFQLKTSLVSPDGTEIHTEETALKVPANSRVTANPLPGFAPAVKGRILLLHTKITVSDKGKAEISGIFGTPAPVSREAGGLFGMNVHLSRYRASTRWRLLQMMKEAGISTVRVDSTFPSENNETARLATIDRLRDDILALEAFGMNSVVCIAYFNNDFHKSPEKQAIAYRWGKRLAEAVQGRTNFHFGNETNSGWGAFGSAHAMSALNQAFALGVAAGDPKALRGSLGIAESPVSYVKALVDNGAMNYLEAVAIHPYCGTPEAGMAKAAAVKSLLRAKGIQAKIWATETGFHVDKGVGELNQTTGELTGVTGFSLDLQAKLLPRLYILGAAAGIDSIYWYDFFGRNDPETFWLVAPDYTPRPAYHALKTAASFLTNAEYLDGTGFDAVIQRHAFRRPDGSLLLACWALKDNVAPDFSIPSACRITDWLGNPVVFKNGILPVLGHGPLYITGFPQDYPQFLHEPKVLISCLDQSDFRQNGIQRFFPNPGDTIQVPLVLFNGNATAIQAKPSLVKGIPGWKISLPGPLEVKPFANAAHSVAITVPADAIPGVEYQFIFQETVNETTLTQPCTVRIKINGVFPYANILHTDSVPAYPMHDSMREAQTGTGAQTMKLSKGTAVIDADLSEWKPEEFHPIDQKFYAALRDTGPIGDDDWKGKAALRWDNERLYAAFLVLDDQLCFPDFISRDWRDSDNIRLLVSAVSSPEKRSSKITENDILVIMTPAGLNQAGSPCVCIAPLGGFVRKNAEAEIKISSKIWQNGYVLEMSMPFHLIHFIPAPGAAIGLNIMADDCDDLHRQSVAMTYLKAFNYWRAPISTANGILE